MGKLIGSRVALALLIVLVDLMVFIIPLAALFLAYVIITRPRWFKNWLDDLYA